MKIINHDTILELKRWNTPTLCNGWELITKHPRTSHFNREPVTDFVPNMGSMVGRAVTVVIEPSNGEHVEANPKAWEEYRTYVASVPGPKIVVVQDRDKPTEELLEDLNRAGKQFSENALKELNRKGEWEVFLYM